MKELNFYLEEMNVHLEEKVEERTSELSKSEKKFRHLFSASKDMVFFGDNKYNLLDINASGLEMLGYARADAPLLDLWKIFNKEEDVDGYFKLIQKVGYVEDREFEFKKKDGSVIYVLLSATAVFDELGKLMLWLGGQDGMNLDGGGSTTMWIREKGHDRGRVVNQPSDGSERPVITAWGVFSQDPTGD